MTPRFNRNLTVALFLTIVFSLSLAGRIAWIASSQLDIAHQALAQGDIRHAIMAYERSIHAYIPYLPSREIAEREMQVTLRQTEAQGNLALSLEGWRRLRAALLSSRSIFGQPDRQLLNIANTHIARLAAHTDTQGKMSSEGIQREAAELLRTHPKDVRSFWGLMQFVFLLLWIASSCALIWIWPNGSVQRRWILACSAGTNWFLWLVCLYMAD